MAEGFRGQKAGTHLAWALAQSPQELILDEPTNYLDIHHHINLMRLASALPITSVIAPHDINHAAMFCDSLIVMQSGKIVASGAREDVVTQSLLRDVFFVDARVESSPYHSKPHIHFVR